MVRYTTPTFSLKLPETVDLTYAENVYVTFSKPDSDSVIITKTGEDLTVAAHQVDVGLSQAETARFPFGKMLIQLNWTYRSGAELKRACTKKACVTVSENLLAEVIE